MAVSLLIKQTKYAMLLFKAGNGEYKGNEERKCLKSVRKRMPAVLL